MFGFVPNQTSEKDLMEDIKKGFINDEENKKENNISDNFNEKNSIIISDDNPR